MSHRSRVVAYWLLILSIIISMFCIYNDGAYAEGNIPPNATTAYPGLDPRLIGIPIIKTDTTAALVAYSRAVDHVNNLENEKIVNANNIVLLTPEVGVAKEKANLRSQELEDIESALHEVIITQYEDVSTDMTVQRSRDPDRLRLSHQSSNVIESLQAAKKKSQNRKKQAEQYLSDVNISLGEAKQRTTTIDTDLVSAKKAAKDTRNVVKSGIPVALIEGLEIPVLTMDAYLRAEKVLAQIQPECGLEWWAIAGIGRAESNHGRFHGAILDQSGTVTPPIIGVALNGEGFAAIGDSDGGLLDGDTQWDHAVGVMQFIPGTWKRWGSDGNGDGVIDPQNVYDSALATAKKLCADAQPNMTTPQGRRTAFLSYNRSGKYADFVEAKGKEYELIGSGRFNPPPVELTEPAQ